MDSVSGQFISRVQFGELAVSRSTPGIDELRSNDFTNMYGRRPGTAFECPIRLLSAIHQHELRPASRFITRNGGVFDHAVHPRQHLQLRRIVEVGKDLPHQLFRLRYSNPGARCWVADPWISDS